jgi:ankyrin repeat protein
MPSLTDTIACGNRSSPSLRSSPTDQLIAAILDGDVQGIRAVVRSKGEDLRSEFWRELTRSVFPLHRAVSGLHFHGSEKLLVATIETLAQLGADVNSCDHAGNSVLHKAIQVCTSKSAAAVVKTLLQRGAHPGIKNKEGDTPLHSECKR